MHSYNISLWFLSGDDHAVVAHNITIKQGSTSTEINVTILDDSLFELDEIFHLEITDIHSSLPYEVHGFGQTTEITILDDECKNQLLTVK